MFLAPGAAARRPTLAAVPGLIPSPPPPPQHHQPSKPQRKVFEANHPRPLLQPGPQSKQGARLGAGSSPVPTAVCPLAQGAGFGCRGQGQPGDPTAGEMVARAVGGRGGDWGGLGSPPGPPPVTATQLGEDGRRPTREGAHGVRMGGSAERVGGRGPGLPSPAVPSPALRKLVGNGPQGFPAPHSEICPQTPRRAGVRVGGNSGGPLTHLLLIAQAAQDTQDPVPLPRLPRTLSRWGPSRSEAGDPPTPGSPVTVPGSLLLKGREGGAGAVARRKKLEVLVLRRGPISNSG